MKMAALQLMQQKANKDSNKTDLPAITEASETSTESNADTTQTQSTTSAPASATESTSPASQAASDTEEKSPNPTSNGPLDPAAAQNGEYKNPLEGKELEESIPGLAQAKELAETLVAEDGSGIGTSENIHKERPGQSRESYSGG